MIRWLLTALAVLYFIALPVTMNVTSFHAGVFMGRSNVCAALYSPTVCGDEYRERLTAMVVPPMTMTVAFLCVGLGFGLIFTALHLHRKHALKHRPSVR